MTRHSERDRDFAFMGWVKQQTCVLHNVDGAGWCGGGSPFADADHAGERAGWRRADDDTCIALCKRHHRDRTERRGYFATWPWDRMRSWCDEQITKMRERYAGWQSANF